MTAGFSNTTEILEKSSLLRIIELEKALQVLALHVIHFRSYCDLNFVACL